MATVVVNHHPSNGPPDPAALVDGPTYDSDPHIVTGLENVDNTSDVDKPVSTAQAAADALVASDAAAATASLSTSTTTALALKAPLASPALTGAPTAPTATAGTNTTQLATTAFVLANGGAGSVAPPQGRVTLTSLTPDMGSSVAGATRVYYTPAVGFQAPLWSGTNWVPTTFAEVFQDTTDTTKSPAAVGASSLYDLFAWNDGGTFRVTRGPAWTNATTRSAGTALVLQNGINLNNAAITNGPAASRGTYVGTIASNASSTIDYIFGDLGVGGVAGVFNVWNAFNRVPVSTTVMDSTDTWTYAVQSVWQAANASSTARVTMVRGLNVDPVAAQYAAIGKAGAATTMASGIGVDSTTAKSGLTGVSTSTLIGPVPANFRGLIGLGQHFVAALEFNGSTTASTWIGDEGAPAFVQSGLIVDFCA